MNMPKGPVVSLVIAQPNLGKTTFILERLSGTPTCLILAKEEHDTFQAEFSEFFGNTTGFTLVDEAEFPVVSKQTIFQNVVFFSFAVWDDNEPAHLDAILALARLAVQKKINVWAALEATSAKELTFLQEAVLKVSAECSSAIFEEVTLSEGKGLLFCFFAKQFCSE